MSKHVAIQGPTIETDAVELSAGSRVFRKQVLRCGSIKYKGQSLDFTPAYLDGLALAHRQQAFDSVPLVFTDEKNRHTQDVERIRGEILGFERTTDGLDAIVQFGSEAAAQLVREHPKLGVSVRIEQPIDRADGQHWPAAIQHVLATANPVVTGMRAWEPVDLAVDDLPVIDLSIYDFAEGEDVITDTEETEMAEKPSPFSDEETARLRALLSELETTETPADAEDGYTPPTDEELAEIAAGLFADDETEAPAEFDPAVVAAASDNNALELAQTQLDAQAIELATIRTERDAERFERLKAELATNNGIPPFICDLAKPLLCGTHVVELASGGEVDAGVVMHKVLTALGDHVKLLDLSNDVVFDGGSAAADEAAAREADVAAYRAQYGL